MKPLKRFVSLEKKLHDRLTFNCGKPSLNQFIAQQASKHMKLGLSTTYVLPASGKNANGLKPIISYYTLSMGQIYRNSLPNVNKFPHYPIPVIVLARLAVEQKVQSRGYGDITLIRAIRHSAAISNTIPAYAMILDVKDEEAIRFYQRYPDFKSLTDNPRRLFLPIQVARKILI